MWNIPFTEISRKKTALIDILTQISDMKYDSMGYRKKTTLSGIFLLRYLIRNITYYFNELIFLLICFIRNFIVLLKYLV